MAEFALLPDTVIHGRYRIVAPIGRGGMGAVYEAIDERLGNRVALKQTLVQGEVAERAFEREARLLAGLRHPALPVVSDFFAEERGRFLVMQFIPGKTLADLLDERGRPFPVDQVLRWADELLRALEHLHGRQPPILHRDIKPANLKLTTEGDVVLLDFGLAKGSGTTTQTDRSVYGLTPQFAPMEQFHGSGTTPASDLFALAASLYMLLAHTPPPDAMTRASAVSLGKSDPLRPASELNPEVPVRVGSWLTRALALHKEDRHSDAAAMRRELTDLRTGITEQPLPTQPLTLPPPTVPPLTPPSVAVGVPPRVASGGGRRLPWWLVAGPAALAVLLAVGWVAIRSLRAPAATTSPSGAEITRVEGEGFEFQWGGEDYWTLHRGKTRIDTYHGTAGGQVEPGTYRIVPNGDAVFAPVEFTVEEGHKTVVAQPSGTVEFQWSGDDYWALFRGKERVATHHGTADRVVTPGAYRIVPNSDDVFEPIELTVTEGRKTVVKRPSGTFEFQWEADDYWVLYRGKQRVATHHGTAGRVVTPGAYRIVPNSDEVFEPIEFAVAEGQTTVVKRPSGTFEFQWDADDYWVLYRGKQRVATHRGTAARVVTPGAYRIVPNTGTPFKPVEFVVVEGRKTVVRPTRQ
jgi:hypothetical protein